MGAVLLAFFALTFAVFERVRGQRAVRRIIAEMTSGGADLNARNLLPPQPASNAAPELVALGKELPDMRRIPPLMALTTPGRAVTVLRLESWTNSQSSDEERSSTVTWTDLTKDLSEVEVQLTRVHKAVRLDGYSSGFNYQRGFHDFEIPGLTDTLKISRWLVAEALVHAKAGRTAESFHALESLTRLVRLLRDERLIISQLVRRAVAAQAFYVLWHTMVERLWTEPQLSTLQQLWRANDFRRDMLRAMEMERAMTMDHWRIQRSSSEALKKAVELSGPLEEFAPEGQLPLKSTWVKLVALPMWKLAWSYHDEFNSLRLWQSRIRDAEAAAGLPWSEMQDNTGDADAASWQVDLNLYDQSRFLFSARSIFSTTVTLQNVYEMETSKELATAAMGVARFRLRNGTLPESVEELTGFGVEQPYDPMDGKPLRYRRETDSGFILYSVGFNGIDDTGDPNIAYEDRAGIWRGKDAVWPEPSE